MKKRFYILLLFLWSFSAVAVDDSYTPYRGRFGLRLSVGSSPYWVYLRSQENLAALNKKFPGVKPLASEDITFLSSLGLGLASQFDVTYGVSNAFEIYGGIRFVPTVYKTQNSTDSYLMPWSMALGLRYYVNTHDPVKFVLAASGLIGLTDYVLLGGNAGIGLQWDITDNVAISGELSGGPALWMDTKYTEQVPYWGVSYLLNTGLGVHYHF